MTRDVMPRMDVDTAWVYHRRWRRVQKADPEGWPNAAAAWFALLGEAWRGSNPDLTLGEAWPPALRADEAHVLQVLLDAGLVDEAGKVPRESWDEWTEPARVRTERARNASASRWNAQGVPKQSPGNAITNQPTNQPSNSSRKRTEGAPSSQPIDMKQAMKAAGLDVDTLPKPKH